MSLSVLLSLLALSFGTMADFEVEVGGSSSCAVSDGMAKCWGLNRFGQLGYEDTATRLEPSDEPIDLGSEFIVDSVHISYSHACAISTSDQLKCWGNGLGAGTGDFRGNIGDSAGEMGDNLEVLSFENVDDVMTLYRVTCVLSGGEVDCFGYDNWITGRSVKTAADPVTLDLGDFEAVSLGGGMLTVCAISNNENDEAEQLKC